MIWTKEDFARYRREQRRLKPGVQATYMRNRRHQMRAVINGLKSKPCADCGQSYPPYVMDFDHVRGVKKFLLTKATMLSLQTVFNEADKCDVVCSNCHRIRTHVRKTAQVNAKIGAVKRWNL